MRVVEPLIGLARPWPVRGKGRLFDPFVPRSGVRDVPVWGRYQMPLDLADVVQRQMYMGCFGFEIARAIRRLLPAGGRFLDVGAHAGYFTLLAAHVAGAGGRAWAVEPNPAMFALLRDTLTRNRVGAYAEALALGAEAGALRLYVPPPGDHRPHNVTCVPQSGWEPIDVPCRRLDDALAGWRSGRIDVMKMDVEGAEPLVLAGGAAALAAGAVRHLITEVNGPRLVGGGSSPAALVEQLARLGFRPARLSGRRAVQVSADGWDLDPAHEYDRLFVHASAAGG